MLTNTHRWSHAPGNTVVPSRWQATEVILQGGINEQLCHSNASPGLDSFF